MPTSRLQPLKRPCPYCGRLFDPRGLRKHAEWAHKLTLDGHPVSPSEGERRFSLGELSQALGQATEMHRELVRVVQESPSAPPTSSTASAEAPATRPLDPRIRLHRGDW